MKRLSYIEEARCLKVNYAIHGVCLRMVLLTDVYRNLTSLWIKPRERAFKQFKSPVLNVLTTRRFSKLLRHLCRPLEGKGLNIFISMSPLAKHRFVASNMLPASHRFIGHLLGLLIRRMEHKITLSTYECANISTAMKLQQNLASTVGVAQAAQWLCSSTHRRKWCVCVFCTRSRRGTGHGRAPNEWACHCGLSWTLR